MKEGQKPETPMEALQNRLCGMGKMMREAQFSKSQRLHVARHLYVMLGHDEFSSVNRAHVFSRYFIVGELSEEDWKLVLEL